MRDKLQRIDIIESIQYNGRMGLYISSYAVRAKSLEKAIGSNDDHLYEDVLKVVGDSFDSTERNALKGLIFNQPPYSRSDLPYYYAFAGLCSYFGQELPYGHDFKFAYITETMDDILESDFGLSINIVETIMNVKRDEFFGLPLDDGVGGLLDRNDLLSLQLQFKKVQITNDLLETPEEEDGELSDKVSAYSLIQEIKEHVSYCVEGNFDLVSFCG